MTTPARPDIDAIEARVAELAELDARCRSGYREPGAEPRPELVRRRLEALRDFMSDAPRWLAACIAHIRRLEAEIARLTAGGGDDA